MHGSWSRAGGIRRIHCTRPSRPFGTPKSARASQELPILAQSLDTRMDPRQLKAMPRYLYRIAM